MKRFFIIIMCILLTALSIPIAIASVAFGLPAQYDRSFYGGMAIKYERICSIAGKKLVVIGGSSVAFSLRSDLIEQELGYPAVNFGLYANLGTKFMLDVAKKHIGADDIVVIAPEQNAQSLSTYFNGEAALDAMDGNFRMLKDTSFLDYKELFARMFAFAGQKFGYYRTNQKPEPAGVYNVKSFDAYGDITYERPYNIMAQGYDPSMPISFARDVIEPKFIDYLNDYAGSLTKAGASVYFAFSPMNKAAMEGVTDEEINDYYNYLRNNLHFPILGNPMTRIMDLEWFFDSNFHLNSAGAQLYTRQLAMDIKAVSGDFSAMTIPIPEKPEPHFPNFSDDDDSTLEDVEKVFMVSRETLATGLNGWRIDGLTDYGKTQEKLTIPSSVDGDPIISIADRAFAGDASVKYVIFGKNISSVGTGAFDGCSSLVGVYITSLDPSIYHPATDVFAGASGCKFYIPDVVYASQYLPDYFWGSAQIKPLLKSYKFLP